MALRQNATKIITAVHQNFFHIKHFRLVQTVQNDTVLAYYSAAHAQVHGVCAQTLWCSYSRVNSTISIFDKSKILPTIRMYNSIKDRRVIPEFYVIGILIPAKLQDFHNFYLLWLEFVLHVSIPNSAMCWWGSTSVSYFSLKPETERDHIIMHKPV